MTSFRDEPARGERAAITGYFPQYRMSAAMIIAAFRNPAFRWIALADPKAGRVDDFQITVGSVVDAYQFKWTRHGGNFSFNDLIKGKKPDEPSLLRQLASGWKKLRTINPKERVVVHLLTNEHPSTNDTVPTGELKPDSKHFAAFLDEAWFPANRKPTGSEIAVPPQWEEAWEGLTKETGLEGEEFLEFVKSCKLEFGGVLPDPVPNDRLDSAFYEQDLRQVTERILKAVYDPENIVRIDRKELVEILGWQDRVEAHYTHTFPVDELLYQPIQRSEDRLKKALTEIDKGYVVVIGPPGSGKSTLLTQTLRYYPERVVSYYAYIPDESGPVKRGESSSFLHDILHQIEQAGFRSGRSPNFPNIDFLRERLRETLIELHKDWLQTGRKTIILIDGLDHIPREQRPARSLLTELPLPEQIPEGVVFVLGTQTDELDDLPTATISSLQEEARRIEIEPLDRTSVHQVVTKAGLGSRLSVEQIDLLYSLSGGHPLDLAYRVKQVADVDDEHVTALFDDAVPYDGQILSRYKEHWRQIVKNNELINLLGSIARLRGAIDLAWIQTWGDNSSVLRDLRRRYGYLFRIENDTSWYFFHNSFKLFVAEQTADAFPGVSKEQQDRLFHLDLASKCRDSIQPQWQWEEAYHLFMAEADADLLEKATPDKFRHQFINFRSAEAIRSDILLGMRAAGRTRDVASLLALILSDAEIAQRAANTQRSQLTRILLALKERRTAIEQAFQSIGDRFSRQRWVPVWTDVLKSGFRKEAEMLFDLAEPLEQLRGSIEVSRYDSDETEGLKTWAKTVIDFRPLDQVLRTIENVSIEPDRAPQADDSPEASEPVDTRESDESRYLQDLMIFHVGKAALRRRRWSDVGDIDRALFERSSGGRLWWFRMRARTWRTHISDGEFDSARTVLSETIDKLRGEKVSKQQLLAMGEALFQLNGAAGEAELFVRGMDISDFQEFPDFQIDFPRVETLFRYVRLLYWLGDERTPTEWVPDANKPRKQGLVFFQRAVCVIARLSAISFSDAHYDRSSIRIDTFPLLRLFNHSWRDSKWDSWYSLSTDIKLSLYKLLIRTISSFGVESVLDLSDDFENEWKINGRWWSSSDRREISLSLFKAGASLEWAEKQLEKVTLLVREKEVIERLDESLDLVRGWLILSKTDRAREELTRTLLDAASIGEKDYQFNEWISWLAKINSVEPENAAERIAWFAEALVDLERNGGPASDAAYRLLEVTIEWKPQAAIKLFSWLLAKELIGFEKGIRKILKASLAKPDVSIELIKSFVFYLVVVIGDADDGLVQRLMHAIYDKESVDGVIAFGKELIRLSSIHAIPEDRRQWRTSLAFFLTRTGIDVEELGLGAEDVNTGVGYVSDSNTLRLSDGTVMSEADVATVASNGSKLLELMDQESEVGLFNWDNCIQHLILQFSDAAQVRSVVDHLKRRKGSDSLIGDLSGLLLKLGDPVSAKNLATGLLAHAGASGWAPHLSGGTKIKAFSVLTAVDGQEARVKAFDQLVEDLNDEYRYTSSIVQYLDEIVPLLLDPLPTKQIWDVIEPHVHTLFPAVDSGRSEKLVSELNETLENTTTSFALIELAIVHMAHPVNLVANCFQRILIELLSQKNPRVIERLVDQFGGNERACETAVTIVEASSNKDAQVAADFIDVLRQLLASPSFSLRLAAQKILKRLDIALPVKRQDSLEQSGIYDLALPPGRRTSEIWADEPLRAETEYLPDTDDPYQLLKIVLPEFDFLAELSGISRDVLVQRGGMVARSLAGDDEWSRLGEKFMRHRFDRASLKFTYRRPQATIARYALSQVIGELVDGNYLSPRVLRILIPILTYYDVDAYFFDPIARPSFVPTEIGYRNLSFEKPEVLLERSLQTTEDGLVIFGEITNLRVLDWELPTETRRSQIGSEYLSPGSGENDFFQRVAKCLRKDYPRHRVDESILSTVISHEGRWFESTNPEWFAFNPTLANELDWKVDDEKLLGWKDSVGKEMVWSVFWKDGLFQMAPPKIDQEVGEGWAVVGTVEAYAQVRDRFSNSLTQFASVKTLLKKDGEEFVEDASIQREMII